MDDVDLRIIQELLSNSRATYRELASKLGLSANAVHKRVQNMVEQGIIEQFTLHLSPQVLPQVWVRVCGKSSTELMDATLERLGKNPSTSMVAVSSGNVLHIVGVLRDFSEVQGFVDFAVKAGEIANPDIRLPNPPRPLGPKDITLTATDYRILAALQGNCRKQIVDVAAELDMSARTIRRRLAELEKTGSVQYRIHFNHALLGGTFTLLDLYVKSGVDTQEVTGLIQNKYSKNMMGMRTFSTLPFEISLDVWTRTMTELKALQDALQKEGCFSRIVPILVYQVAFFDTWRESYILERATTGRSTG